MIHENGEEFILEHVESEEKDLGIIFEESLSFNTYIHRRIKKANSMMGLIRRVFSYLGDKSFQYLYCAFVRSLLESSQSVWYPSRPCLAKHLKGQPNSSIASNLWSMEYEERLRRLNLYSVLHYRRIRGDMIEMWKHFNTYDENMFPEMFQHNTQSYHQHTFQLYQHRPTTHAYSKPQSKSFYRVPRLRNKLPSSVVSSPTMETFKNRLDRHWAEEEFRYNCGRHHLSY